jgi:hypothetical protein
VELMLHFYAVPRWVLSPDRKSPKPGPEDRLDPDVPKDAPEGAEKALARAEYAGDFALERIEDMLKTARGPVVLASPPNDLPALLRTADQLDLLARQDVGEKARVWRCDCGTHYAVPVQLIRPVAIRCERCGRMVDFEIGKSVGEQNLSDVGQSQTNAYRKGLSEFFREAMARGWPVLVANE